MTNLHVLAILHGRQPEYGPRRECGCGMDVIVWGHIWCKRRCPSWEERHNRLGVLRLAVPVLVVAGA